MQKNNKKETEQCTLHGVSHSTFIKREYTTNTKDRAWQDPNCRIVDTRTGETLKDYGTIISPT